ncbi:MAG: cytochrome c biogenesis protein ResB [Eubacteriales bacterium]|nr:cytochrome c biogenesis protein ResB [Eubacteriales bacterium]
MRFIFSMRFAVILLLILATVCAAASIVPQNRGEQWYFSSYPAKTASLIILMGLDDAYHSWWFVTIGCFLCLNLMICNVIRLPELVKRYRRFTDPSSISSFRADAGSDGIKEPEEFFRKLGMGHIARGRDEQGRETLYSCRNAVGLWGAWVCHLGILLLIVGFGLGQMMMQQYAVYGVAGQIRPIEDTGYTLSIDDFAVELRDDDTVSQYRADITVTDPSGRSESAEISVNNPAKLFGMKFYQNSTGWAASVSVYKNGELLQKDVICAGEYVTVSDLPDLAVYLNAFYPDYIMSEGRPATASGRLNNPGYLYSIYYRSQIVGMNVLLKDEKITVDDYTIIFDEPQSYTVVQIKRDPFTPIAFTGGMVVMLGLMINFYMLTRVLWAVRDQDGSWSVYGYSPKGGSIFRDEFEKAVQAVDGKPDKRSERKDPNE